MHPAWALLGAVPAIVAMWLVDRLDRRRPEPPRTLRLVGFAGLVSVLPCIGLEVTLIEAGKAIPLGDGSYEHAAFHGYVVAAGVEELAKALVIFLVVWRRPEFDERMDGIVYGARAGLGFALIENVMYLHSATQSGDARQFWVMFVGRALLAVPGHAVWAACIGYFAARRRFDRVGPGVIGGYLIAVFLHGTYDAAIFSVPAVFQSVAAVKGLVFLEAYQWHIVLGMHAIPVVLTVAGIAMVRRMARIALRGDDAAAPAGGRVRISMVFGVPPAYWDRPPDPPGERRG